MTLYMRMVAISRYGEFVIVQERLRLDRVYEQIRFTFNEFDDYMKLYFPNYYKFYEMATDNEHNICSCAEWFYHFGETKKMIEKGECYIYHE